MQQCHREQMAFKEMRREAERKEEAAYREAMLAKFAEDDRIEQMNAQKRRMKQLEHRRAVEELIEERKRQRQADMVTTRWAAGKLFELVGPKRCTFCTMEKNAKSLNSSGELRRGQALETNCQTYVCV